MLHQPLENQIIVSFITSIITALLAYWGLIRKTKIELRKEFTSKYNIQKWEVYTQNIALMDLYYKQGNFELLHPDISKETLDNLEYKAINEEISRLENKLELDILLVGSKEVVEAYIKWRRLLIGGVYSNSDAFEQMITCINVMRKDLGLEEAELSLQIFDEYAYISEQTYKKRRKEV